MSQIVTKSRKQSSQSFSLSNQQQQQQNILQTSLSYPSKYITLVRSSLINKSCIHTSSFVNQMHGAIPQIKNPDKIQRLDISGNFIKILKLNLPNLKQLIANKNNIENLPQELNSLAYLRILKVNNNRISIIPYLKNIQYLQITKNPIKLITSQIKIMNIKCLQFDWLQYLIPQTNYLNRQQVFNKFKELINQIDFQKQNNLHFLDFGQFFRVNKNLKINQVMPTLIHKAIMQKASFFLQFIKVQFYKKEQSNQQTININQMMYLGKSLLEYALQNQNNEAIQLFMLRRRNLNDTESFFSNLQLACRYSHLDLFQFLMGSSGKKILIMGKQMQLIKQLLIGFSELKSSHVILRRILQFYGKHSKGNQIKIQLPLNYSAKDLESISNGLLFILQNQNLKKYFTFNQNEDQKQQQPLFHFAALSKCPALIDLLIKQGLNPFIKNVYGIPPRMIRGSLLGRKLLWKHQKNQIKSTNLTEKKLIDQLNYEYQIKDKKLNSISIDQKFMEYSLEGKNFSSVFNQTQLITPSKQNLKMYKSLSIKDYLKTNYSTNCSQLFGANTKNIPKCLQLIHKSSYKQTKKITPKTQNYISLHPPSTKARRSPKLKLETLKKMEITQKQQNFSVYQNSQAYQNMIFTLKNLNQPKGGILGQQIVKQCNKFQSISRKSKTNDFQSLLSQQNDLKNYQLFHSICNNQIERDFKIDFGNGNQLRFLKSPIKFCQQVKNEQQYDDKIRRKRKGKTNIKQRLTLTQV